MKEPTLPFPVEVLDEFTYTEDKSITHVLSQIYEPIAERNVKKVSVTKVTAALKDDGYLLDEPNPETGKTRKAPSVKGKELGICCEIDKKISRGGIEMECSKSDWKLFRNKIAGWFDIAIPIRDGVITIEDLDGFSEELKEHVQLILGRRY